jgi:beta-lactam-binding protein with PASTA domain
MGFFQRFKERRVLYHLAGGLLFLLFSLFATTYWLKIYTHHGEAIVVPDFSGFQSDEAIRMAEDKNMLPQIYDSVYYADKEPGTVVDQYPKPNHRVKRDRLILFTVCASEPDRVPLPDLTGITVRQATADAEMAGFRIGKLSYVPDISTTVVHMTYKGKKVKSGTVLAKGSVIDLTVGRGTSNDKTSIPSVTGLGFYEAEEKLLSAYLNPGNIVYDKTVKTAKDSVQAKVWKQYPRPGSENEVSLGTYVDIWLTIDPDLIPSPETESKNEETP